MQYDVQVAFRPLIVNGIPKMPYSEDKSSEYYLFWDEQFRRCIAGYQPEGYHWIPGRLYFYLNFCKIKVDDKTGQRKETGTPYYRHLDYEIAMTFEKAKYNKKGIIEPKAREVGATVSSVCMTILHEVVFFEASEVAIATGSEDEIKAAKEVLSLAYNELPDELRSDMIDENKELWRFGFVSHEITGQGKKTIDKELGLKSIIHFKDSLNRKPNQLNSFRLSWTFIDECGLINGLKNIHILNKASYESDLIQFGCPIYAGTAKAFASKDADYEEMFDNCDKFNLIQMFIPKRKAIFRYMDYKTGKVDEAKGQAEIDAIYDKYKNDPVGLAKVQQESPSEPAHCWMRKSGGLLPLQIINPQIQFLKTHPHFNPRTKEISEIEIGELKWANGRFGGEVEWVATEKGNIKILEHPKEIPYKNLYCGGVDPYTKEATVESDSKGACVIYKRFLNIGEECEMPILVYEDRPQGTVYEAGKRLVGKSIFYNNLFKIAKYYGCKLLVEDTDEELFSWFRENFASSIALARKPTSSIQTKSNQQNKYGVVRTDGTIVKQTDLLDRNLTARPDGIKFVCLLENMRGWGAKNTDIADAYAYALMLDDEMNMKRFSAREEQKEQIETENKGGAQWVRDPYTGVLSCVSDKSIFAGLRKMKKDLEE